MSLLSRRSQVRIPLIAAIVTLLFLSLLGLVARTVVRTLVFRDVDDEIRTLSIAIGSDLELQGLRVLEERPLRAGVISNIFAFRLENHSAVLLDRGHIVATSGQFVRRDATAAALDLARHDERPFIGREPFSGQGRRTRFLVTHLSGSAPGATLIMFRSIEPALRTLDRFDLALLGIVLIGVLGSAGITAYAVRRALRPVEEVTRVAEIAEAADLTGRVNVTRGGEEVDHLVRVVNSLFERLQRAFESQGRFVSDAAHELKTPVAAIAAEAQEASRSDTSSQQRNELLRSIERSARALARETNDLLTLARGEAAPLEWKSADLKQLATTATSVVAQAARAKHLNVTMSSRGDVTVEGDPLALERAIVNLLSNAAHYTADGSEVEVEIDGQPADVTIHVRDRGPGIPRHERERVFERFVRLPRARVTNPEGSGLGLAIVAQAVRNHGGSVSVEDRAGGGCEFIIRLPRRRRTAS